MVCLVSGRRFLFAGWFAASLCPPLGVASLLGLGRCGLSVARLIVPSRLRRLLLLGWPWHSQGLVDCGRCIEHVELSGNHELSYASSLKLMSAFAALLLLTREQGRCQAMFFYRDLVIFMVPPVVSAGFCLLLDVVLGSRVLS